MSHTSRKNLFSNKRITQRINQVKKIICQKLKPERILLYGSYAQKKADQWSDIDLIIISSQVKQKREIDRSIFIDRFLSGTPPIQSFVFTQKEYDKMLKMKSSFLQYVLPQAKIIYQKSS